MWLVEKIKGEQLIPLWSLEESQFGVHTGVELPPLEKQIPHGDTTTRNPQSCPRSRQHKPCSTAGIGNCCSRRVLGGSAGVYSLSSTPIQVLLLPEGSSHSFPPHRTGNTECDPHIPVGRARATLLLLWWPWQMSLVCGDRHRDPRWMEQFSPHQAGAISAGIN